jgi:hypothetical protein
MGLYVDVLSAEKLYKATKSMVLKVCILVNAVLDSGEYSFKILVLREILACLNRIVIPSEGVHCILLQRETFVHSGPGNTIEVAQLHGVQRDRKCVVRIHLVSPIYSLDIRMMLTWGANQAHGSGMCCHCHQRQRRLPWSPC